MSTSAKELRETLTAHCRHERHRTYAETSYWLSQYKDLARRAVQHSETLAAKLQEQTERAEAAETELRKLREQKPVAYAPPLDMRNIPKYGRMTTLKAEDEYATYIPLYAAPVPAPAVPAEWREVMSKLVGIVESSTKFHGCSDVTKQARALLQSAPQPTNGGTSHG